MIDRRIVIETACPTCGAFQHHPADLDESHGFYAPMREVADPDTLIVEKVNGEWPDAIREIASDAVVAATEIGPVFDEYAVVGLAILDALLAQQETIK